MSLNFRSLRLAESARRKKMSEKINHDRRRFLTTALITIVSAELALIGAAAAQRAKPLCPRCSALACALQGAGLQKLTDM